MFVLNFNRCAERLAVAGNPRADTPNPCPYGVTMWRSVDFTVPYGSGGALFSSSPGASINILSSRFENNTAGSGSNLKIVGARHLIIRESIVEAGSVESTVDVDSCRPGACNIGQQCVQQDGSDGIFCDVCPKTTYGNGNVCETCPAGKQPTDEQDSCAECPDNYASEEVEDNCSPCHAGQTHNERRTECVACEDGTHRTVHDEQCTPCPAGKEPTEDQGSCVLCQIDHYNKYGNGNRCQRCDDGQVANVERTKCVCEGNTYNPTDIGAVSCNGISSVELDLGDSCIECPSCMDCTESLSPSLQPGWAFYGHRQAYRCKGDVEVAQAACPGGPLKNRTISTAEWQVGLDGNFAISAFDAQCGAGSSGPICANCDDEYHHIKVGRACELCDDESVNIVLIVGALVMVALATGIVLSGVLNKFADHGLITDLRLVIGFWQQLSQMGNVLAIVFPQPVPFLVDILSLFSLDVLKLLQLDCWDIGAHMNRTRALVGIASAHGYVLVHTCDNDCALQVASMEGWQPMYFWSQLCAPPSVDFCI
eukprot:COSAG02_NODE_2730_length_8142_cov_5.078080_3_plen_538_part_00